MSDRPPGRRPVERVRGERPTGVDWRADGVARSRHSRLADHLVEPIEDHDPRRAERICGEICRAALVDLAPAFLLLPPAERRRARVLAAYALTLFDLATRPGLDGDRLAELNRWQFRLEEALDGQPAGQPIFVLLAREEAITPWPREALDRILAAARGRALAAARTASTTATRTATRTARHPAATEELAQGLAAALLGEPVSEDAIRLARELLLATGARESAGNANPAPTPLGHRLRDVPRRWRAAARYLELAGRRLGGGDRDSARLGLTTRLTLLLRARLGL